jgi:hypothetical protein
VSRTNNHILDVAALLGGLQMTCKLIVRSSLVVVLAAVLSASLSAERVEIFPNAGFIWPHHMDNGQNFRDQAIWGFKGGVFVGHNMQLEGSFEYLNHFQLREPPNPFNPVFGIVQPAVRGFLYDVNFTYNFGQRQLFKERTIIPFASVGGGGLTAYIPDAPFIFIQGGGNVINGAGAVVPNPVPFKIMDSGATFFTVNYGGGVKFPNAVGPIGFRVDVRGRTIPNFFGERTTWVEPTAGIIFAWGER